MPEWLNNISGILLVVFFFGFSVFIHEFGHLLAAVWRGLHVEKFSIGFGHRIWGFKRKGVDFIVGWLPFGGYVALPQLEPNDEPMTSDGKILEQPKPIDKIIVAVAGPLFNLLFAFLLGVILWKAGKPVSPPVENLVVTDIPAQAIDYQKGLRNGDKILAINGKEIKSSDHLVKEYVLVEHITLDVERDGEKLKIGPFEPAKDADIENLAFPPFTFKENRTRQKAIVNIVPKLSRDKKIKFPAKEAGVLAGDRIIKVDGVPIEYESEVSEAINAKKGEALDFTVLREGKEVVINIKPAKVTEHIIGLKFANFPKVFLADSSYPAYKAGIRRWDKILSVNGKAVDSLKDFEAILQTQKDRVVDIKVDRAGEEMTFPVTVKHEHYLIGVRWQGFKSYMTPYDQFSVIFSETFKTLNALVSQKVPIGGLSGPVGISKGIYDSWQYLGIIGVLSFIFMINISLAIFNLLPLPVLDGGHIFVATAELISRRKIPAKVLQPVTLIFILFFF
ncbi:MAG: RIP metalloprotease RseP, partial [Lentisphaeraceae bacterium]|nr:RIP metalloprotease RseP [Lentisphaeraceae bacterium]